MKYTLIMLLASSLPVLGMDMNNEELERQRVLYEELQQQTLRKMEDEFERALRESLQTSSSQSSRREIPQTHTPYPSFAEFGDDEVLQTALRESLQMSHQTSQTSTFEEDVFLAQRLQNEEIDSRRPQTTTTRNTATPSHIDPASAELIYQLEAEDSYIDPASAALIQQLQSMNLREDTTYSHYDRSVRARFAYVVPTAAREDFNKLKKDILTLYRDHGADVHAGDKFICNNAATLLAIASLFDEHLSGESKAIHHKNLLQIQDQILHLIAPYEEVLNQYAYQDIKNNIHKNYAQITQIIRNQFARSNNEIGSYAGGQGTMIWARFVALAAERLNDPYTSDEIKKSIAMILAEKTIEGMLTQGGCIQGFVNRGFIGLLTMLGLDLSDGSEGGKFQSN